MSVATPGDPGSGHTANGHASIPSPAGTPAIVGHQTLPILRWKRGTSIRAQWAAPVGVEQQDIEQPVRTTLIQTLGGAQIDHWGPGVSRLMISGTTGWGPHGIAGLTAYEALKALVADYTRSAAENPNPAEEVIEYLHPFSMTHCYCVIGEAGLTLQQSRSEPMIRRWQLPLIVVRDLQHAGRDLERPIVKVADGQPSTTPAAISNDAGKAKTQPVGSNPPASGPRG